LLKTVTGLYFFGSNLLHRGNYPGILASQKLGLIKVRDRERAHETVALAAGSGEQQCMETNIPNAHQLGRRAAARCKTGLCTSMESQASMAPPELLLLPVGFSAPFSPSP